MSETVDRLNEFVAYVRTLKGDEKGEAQVFCDRLFRAFGHGGYKEANATLEDRVRNEQGTTGFVDLMWRPRLLLEMKKRGEDLSRHYRQAFDYWVVSVPRRPRYVVLCNFDEFWIYDFDRQLSDPVDVVKTVDLPHRYDAFNFMLPTEKPPVFGNDREAVTREAAMNVARVFESIVKRGESRDRAQRFILQLVVAMFAEDIDLLPKGVVVEVIQDCLENNGSPYDLFGALFRQMNNPTPARGGRFERVRYFNGGLYAVTEPIELSRIETILLGGASKADWSKVDPAIFGTLFQYSMSKGARHMAGAHYTAEADIMRVVTPTITAPWRRRIESAKTAAQLLELRSELHAFRVLDPACGSGNFLYVAFREIARLEIRIVERLHDLIPAKDFAKRVRGFWLPSPHNFLGIERDPFGVELAKVTLMLAKKLAMDEGQDALNHDDIQFPLTEDALPLDNLDQTLLCADALFIDWPEADAIIGNPPYQSKNKMQSEFGADYMDRLRSRYPEIPGRADYCVYWFRRAHDRLKADQRAGLVGTNTIRQNFSREGGLDYIVANGGTITDAVSTQDWSGEANVSVSIVNWKKGAEPGPKTLSRQVGTGKESTWEVETVAKINSALSFDIDVASATALQVNKDSQACFQGQTHGNNGFIVKIEEARSEIKNRPESVAVLRPYLIGTELLGKPDSKPARAVIDFGDRDVLESRRFPRLFARVEKQVLLPRQQAAAREAERNAKALKANPKARVNHHHAGFLDHWWLLSWPRPELMRVLRAIPRYAVCVRVTKRPIFEFVCSDVNPNDSLSVFPLADDYSFGILQSSVHWQWFVARCSTLTERFRYTSDTVFDSFPWPQNPSEHSVAAVALAARALREERRLLMKNHNLSLRGLYQTLDKPGKHPLKDAQARLDAAVRIAFGMDETENILSHLLALNAAVAAREKGGEPVTGPGLPPAFAGRFISDDCVAAPLMTSTP